jgi:hypothetical protein
MQTYSYTGFFCDWNDGFDEMSEAVPDFGE